MVRANGTVGRRKKRNTGVKQWGPRKVPFSTPKYDWNDVSFTIGAVVSLLLFWCFIFWGLIMSNG